MRRLTLCAASLASLMLLGTGADAQQYREYREYRTSAGGPLRLNVRPRSWLDAGNTVAPYSSVNPASAQGQLASYLNSPPYRTQIDRFGGGTLPDPITNGPFPGATNPFGPIDFENLGDE